MTDQITRGTGNVMDDIGLDPAFVILKMIETVDPADEKILDEIDARVWCFLKGYILRPHNKADTYNYQYEIPPMRGLFISSLGEKDKAQRYTRSRDALKAIRPEGWVWEIQASADYRCFCSAAKPTHKLSLNEVSIENGGNTEELAELHAIIQAIQYERSL